LTSDPLVLGNLLDTHAILWTVATPHLLSDAAYKAIACGPNFLSVVSYWEVAIKSMKGKIDVGDVSRWWTEAVKITVATPVLLRPAHVDALQSLPPIHKDPFDRMLIAQAMTERLTLVSMDPEIARYASDAWSVIG